jgi:hypothetical protein
VYITKHGHMKLEKMDGRGEGDKEEENKVGWIK